MKLPIIKHLVKADYIPDSYEEAVDVLISYCEARGVKDEELDFAHELVIYGQDGKEAARVVYRPYDPLPSEAVVWVETDNDVKMIVHESN